jgi:hypothetical protein
MRLARKAIVLAALAAIGAAGCGSENPQTPDVCLQGPQAFRAALAKAPGDVTLAGGVHISDCLVQNQPAGDLATVGGALVRVATELNVRGRADPNGPAPYELGYLVGAVRIAAADTGGVHAELARRVASAARFSGGRALPPAFRRAYERGLGAGRAGG